MKLYTAVAFAFETMQKVSEIERYIQIEAPERHGRTIRVKANKSPNAEISDRDTVLH